MKKTNREQLRQKISSSKNLRRNAIFGLIFGIIMVVLGQFGSSPLILFIGYIAFLVCTALISFLTALIWLYSKTIDKALDGGVKVPSTMLCPRCGAAIGRNRKYCKKCGKKIAAKKT